MRSERVEVDHRTAPLITGVSIMPFSTPRWWRWCTPELRAVRHVCPSDPRIGHTVGAMTERSPAVTISHPPDAVLRRVNPILRYLLRTPVAGTARQQMMVVSFTGRKTGRRYSIPVSALRSTTPCMR